MNKVFVLRELRHVENLMTFLAGNWQAMSQTKNPLQVTCRPENKKRSLQALKYYWQMLRQIEAEVWIEGRQYTADPCWHEMAKRKFIGCVDLPGGGSVAMSTDTLDAKEFAVYVTKVEAWAATEFGVTFIEQGAA
jgi:hypothetical protein